MSENGVLFPNVGFGWRDSQGTTEWTPLWTFLTRLPAQAGEGAGVFLRVPPAHAGGRGVVRLC